MDNQCQGYLVTISEATLEERRCTKVCGDLVYDSYTYGPQRLCDGCATALKKAGFVIRKSSEPLAIWMIGKWDNHE